MIIFLFFLFFTPLLASSQELGSVDVPAGVSAGVSAKELNNVDVSKKELNNVDVSAKELNNVDVSAKELNDVDVSKKELNDVDVSKKELDNTDKTKHSISIHLESEGQLSKNKISKNQKEFYPHLPYAEFGFGYSKNDNLNFFINFEAESYENEWQIGLDEFYLSYAFETVPISIKSGWLILPLGYMDQNSNVFSQDLSLYGPLTYSQEDIGLVTDIYIWREFLSLQAGVFGGWTNRPSDNFYKAPDSIPFMISLKSHGSFWDTFISWYESDPAFLEPLQAFGGGAELKASYKKLTVSVQSELWQIMGKKQTTFAYYVFPKLSVYKLQAGMLFGDINRFFPNFKASQVKSSAYEKIFQMSYQVHPNILLMGERFISKQRRGLLTNDSWAVRVKVHFDWSRDL